MTMNEIGGPVSFHQLKKFSKSSVYLCIPGQRVLLVDTLAHHDSPVNNKGARSGYLTDIQDNKKAGPHKQGSTGLRGIFL